MNLDGQPIKDEDASAVIKLYERWCNEVAYRRNRTSFITTWSTTLFLAITGALLSVKGQVPNLGQNISGAVLIGVTLVVALAYFYKNSRSHMRAALALLSLEERITINGSTMLALYPGGQTKDDARSNYFSEKGSAFQAALVILVALVCIVALVISGCT